MRTIKNEETPENGSEGTSLSQTLIVDSIKRSGCRLPLTIPT